MRKQDRKQLAITISKEQHAKLKELAGDEGVSAYLRRLAADDAKNRGESWPDNLPSRGQHKR